MNCEYCRKTLRERDTVHGVKYGVLGSDGRFRSAVDSAPTILCGTCGEKVYRLVYASLDKGTMAYPTIFNMYNELTTLMKNGYKLIQSISKLPSREQLALQRLITTCKEVR